MTAENDDDAMMELIMGGGFNDEEDGDNQIHYEDADDNRPDTTPRAFRLLWDALSAWVTPQTVQWVQELRNASSSGDDTMDREMTAVFDRTDIGSSRCAGVMAMIKLYLSGCMEELKYPTDTRRKAEKRLTERIPSSR
ncbi:MAG: hypothetical protein SGARI_004490 [Bacillariaceae sp.]